ncbi:RNA methyltransferase [Candidatus Woesearchaeota archaeon]|nr:RNA methyltransferase [Candidatus Woesearchaeota archaeon]
MIDIILIEPENPGNIGAIARSMKNFGLKNLILINPKCNHLSLDAIKRAKHANNILKNAKIEKISYLKKFHTVIATTSKLGTDYNLPRSPITPEQLAQRINTKTKIAIIFGRESSGLLNKELELADFIVTIPTSTKYPALNLSHAATIIFYELAKKLQTKKIGQQITPASKQDKEQLLKMIYQNLDKLKFATPQKKITQIVVWKRIISKAFLTKREAFAIMGFFKKLL